MRIIIATPLYPPEIAAPAQYIKELAHRLSKTHQVAVLAYAHLPEQIVGVRTLSVDKRQMLVLRLARFMWVLWREARKADIVYAQNGAASELAAGLVSALTRTPLVLCVGDVLAQHKAEHRPPLAFIQHFALRRAERVVTELPCERPEIISFLPYPEAEFAVYERSWTEHLAALHSIFSHAAR